MSQPEEPIFSTESPQPSRDSRRRRATRRSSIPTDAEGQASLISDLSRRAYPSIELFIFSLVCGTILGLGFLLDSQIVLLLGILVAPLMTPWVGFLLAILTGSIRFLFETIMALLISITLVFVGGFATGLAGRLFQNMPHNNAFIHARLWVPSLIVLAIGAITLVISFARSEEKPFLPSVLIAYIFYIPISAASFGLGYGLENVWPQGIYVFLAHFALASMLGLVTLYALRLRPSPSGVIFSGVALLIFIAILIPLLGSYQASSDSTSSESTNASAPAPTLTLDIVPTSSEIIPAANTSAPRIETATPKPQTNTPVSSTLNVTLPPSATPTITLTLQPTPIYGRISANEGGGANLRDAPEGTYILTLLNGTIVETDSQFEEVNGITWIHVFATVNNQKIEGWLLDSVITYATPSPNFEPASTPTP